MEVGAGTDDQRQVDTPRRAHRRSFVRTTTVATAGLVVLLASVAALVVMVRGDAIRDRVPAWVLWPVAVAVLAVLLALIAYAALVVLGGFTVLHRDACEDRGVPYTPTRPRERVVSPLRATLRRRLRPGAPWHPGELVEVRSLPEIMATLDDRGCLDGLPFMPEMAAYCGHRVRVHRRVDKVWEYAHGTGLRRVERAVLLEQLRCDGGSHGGCQSACQLIWKEAWLRAPDGPGTPTAAPERWPDLAAASVRIADDGARRYVCQMTEIARASSPLSQRSVRHYWGDLVHGNVRVRPLLTILGVRAFNGLNWRFRGAPWPVLDLPDRDSSPPHDAGLQPGQWVRVRSKREIEATLNRQRRNRGMEFGFDMLACCGGSYRVAARVDHVLNEATGELLHFKMPSILLEGAHANGGTVLTPQNEYYFWREIWLEPHPAPTEPVP